jgi:O-antigen/teichoic acid export membrane protein
MNTEINRRIVAGAGWLIALGLTDRLIGFFSILILARLLLPHDFGLVGYAMAFIGILEVFFQFSFQTVLIRDQDAPRESYDTAWTLDLIKGVSLAALLLLAAPNIAAFFGEADVEAIIRWVALLPLLKGLENIGIVEFQKSLQFHREFYFNLSARLVGTVLAIVLAVMLRNYWALVAGSIARSLCRVALSYAMSAYRPRADFSKFDRVFGFSKWMLLQNILYGIVDRLPTIIIGRFHSPQAVAFFNMANELSHLASYDLAAPVRRALLPGVVKISGNAEHLAEILAASIGSIALIGLPVTVGIAVAAPMIIPVLLGENWLAIIPIIQVMAITALSYILYSNSNVVLVAMNKPHVTAYISGLQAVILVSLTLWLVPDHGAIGAAWALSLTNIVIMAVDYIIVFRLTDLTLRNVIAATWRSVASVAVMGAIALVTMGLIGGSDDGFSRLPALAAVVAAGAVSYVLSVWLLWRISGRPPGGESYVLSRIAGFLGRGGGSRAAAE